MAEPTLTYTRDLDKEELTGYYTRRLKHLFAEAHDHISKMQDIWDKPPPTWWDTHPVAAPITALAAMLPGIQELVTEYALDAHPSVGEKPKPPPPPDEP